MLSARRAPSLWPIIGSVDPPLIVTPDLARRIEHTHIGVGRARARHLPSVAGNPLGLESRGFGSIEATIVRRAVWYYGYFAGLSGAEPGTEQALDDALAWSRAAGQVVRLHVSPMTANASWMAALLARGLRPDSFMTMTWMHAQAIDREPASGTTVREDREAYLDSRLVTVPEGDRALIEALQRAEFTEARCYVAEVDGVLAARAAMFIVDRAASLVATDTAQALRGRGAQTALLHRRMNDAVAAGCDLIVCAATPGSISQRNQERVGMRIAYTRTTWIDGTIGA